MEEQIQPERAPEMLMLPPAQVVQTAEEVEQSRTQHARTRTPAQLERQERVFNLSVIEGKTIRQIAAEVGICADTVISDLRHESQRRADEIAERREVEKARAVSTYEMVIGRAIRKSDMYDELAQKPGAKVTDRTLDAIIHARERIDKVLGVDAPTKVDLGLDKLFIAFDDEG